MDTPASPFDTRAEDALGSILKHYEEFCEIHHHYTVGGQTVRAAAEYHITHEKTVLGFSFGKKMGHTEANEYLFFLQAEHCGQEAFEAATKLCEEAEERLLDLHPSHAYTLFSAVTITDRVDRAIVQRLKHYKARSSYRYGWGMTRIVALELGGPVAYCNGDGRDLGRLLLSKLR